jgi:hypothetical protein
MRYNPYINGVETWPERFGGNQYLNLGSLDNCVFPRASKGVGATVKA